MYIVYNTIYILYIIYIALFYLNISNMTKYYSCFHFVFTKLHSTQEGKGFQNEKAKTQNNLWKW